MTGMKEEWPLEFAQEGEVIAVCQKLVQLISVNPPGNERAVAGYVADYLRTAGVQVELVDHGPDRASVLARLKGTGERPGLLYSAHLDTVPVGKEKWLHEPFSGELAEGKLWGRGSSDMKGGMAGMMVAAKVLAAAGAKLKGDLIMAFTAGEEVDSLGAVALAGRQDLLPLQALIVSEPSSNEIFVAEKGALWIQLETHGQTAHGSMPELGRNAIMMMVALINALEKVQIPFDPHPMLGGFSRSFNTIAGGVKTNVVPDHCELTIDMRTVPGQDHQAIVKKYEEVLAALKEQNPEFRATLTVLNDRPPVTTAADHPVVSRFNQVLLKACGRTSEPKGVRYYTDAAALIPVWPDVPMVICGPGEARLAHQPNEYVAIDLLEESVKIFTLAAMEFLG